MRDFGALSFATSKPHRQHWLNSDWLEAYSVLARGNHPNFEKNAPVSILSLRTLPEHRTQATSQLQ